MMRKGYITDLVLEKMEITEDTQTTGPPLTHYTSFTSIIREGSSVTTKLLQNGPHFVFLLENKSLETFLARVTPILLISILKKPFIPGWLYEIIVNSFFWCL